MLLAITLSSAFDVQVEATGTIYIRADGSIDPPTVPMQRDGDIYTFTDDISEPIVVQRSNIVIDGNGYRLQYPGGDYYMSGFHLFGIGNVIIRNTNINGFPGGIYFRDCTSNSITGNNITNNSLGVELYDSSYNSIVGNNITNNGMGGYGIYLGYSSSNEIVGNDIANKYWGIYLDHSSNSIYHNNFINNVMPVTVTVGYTNSWDDGYPSGGNYWSDYTEKYPDAEELDDSGIWNTPYVIDPNNQDNYPLIDRWTPIPAYCGWPVLVAPLQISSRAGYSVGDTLTARFAVQNQGTAAIHLDKLVLGGRFNGGTLPSGGYPDFTFHIVTLQVDQTYQYEGTLDITEAGYYQFFVAYYIANPTEAERQLLDPNNWNTCIDLAPGLTDSDRTWSCRMRIYGIPPDFTFQHYLEYGYNDPEVRYLQIMLNSDPYTRVASSGDGSPGSETCSFGDLTRNAVKKFQEKHDLPKTDSADAQTRSKLNEVLAQKFSWQIKDEFGLLDLEQRKFTIWSDINTYIDEMINDVRRYPYLENFPAELVLAIACVESGDYADWNNEHVSFDWGRGIMQITWDPLVGAGGVDSSSDDCIKCRNRVAKVYCSRYYSNTWQGIEANIKDSLYALDENCGEIIRKDKIIPPADYSIEEVVWISTVQKYNCYSATRPTTYVESVGEELLNLANGYYGQFDGFDNSLATSLGNKFLGAYSKSSSFRIYSPGELQVYDESGNVAGVVNGLVREDIPNSFFDNRTETVVIFFPQTDTYCEVRGKETGVYGLGVFNVENGTETAFSTVDITTSLNSIHQYAFNWTALLQSEEGVAVQVDSDGDGVFEHAFESDGNLTRHEYVVATNGADTGITGVETMKNVIGEGFTLLTNVTVVNYGASGETFNVTLYVNETLAESQTTTLDGGNTTTVFFEWGTSSFAKSNYTVSVVIDQVSGETYTLDNTFVYGWVLVTIPGDVNGDRTVDSVDLIDLNKAYGSIYGSSNWNANSDINGDNKVDVLDLFIHGKNYGQTFL